MDNTRIMMKYELGDNRELNRDVNNALNEARQDEHKKDMIKIIRMENPYSDNDITENLLRKAYTHALEDVLRTIE
jgi:hypothetical protein